jgi:hypothetical protein
MHVLFARTKKQKLILNASAPLTPVIPEMSLKTGQSKLQTNIRTKANLEDKGKRRKSEIEKESEI